jgi:hypothetical protein
MVHQQQQQQQALQASQVLKPHTRLLIWSALLLRQTHCFQQQQRQLRQQRALARPTSHPLGSRSTGLYPCAYANFMRTPPLLNPWSSLRFG